VAAVLTGHIGRKATTALQTAGVKIYLGASGRLKDAIASFTAGKYEEKT
jgi:predicted Fe-Mo cluster-binding NifX family protein